MGNSAARPVVSVAPPREERENRALPRIAVPRQPRNNALKDRSNLQPHGLPCSRPRLARAKCGMIPEPDYSDSEDDPRKMRTKMTTEDGLVLPKKLPNPCLESTQRISLHRELLFNQKIGKKVLNQKSELDRVLEKKRDEQKRKELEREKLNNKTDFEKKLEEQANKIRQLEEPPAPTQHASEPQLEFLKVRARLCAAQAVGTDHS